MKKRWKVTPVDRGLQEVLGQKLSILPLTAQLLINRGLVDCDKAFSFLRPSLADLHDPFLLKDMDRAVERTVAAIGKREKIAVYGDYDVDGTTSTALMYLFFREIGVDLSCYIPERITEGYGLNAGAVKLLASEGVKLVITVDCGSSNHDEIALANTLGVDVIVSDHHELPEVPPPACAVLNPKQKGCAFPFKGLAGVGVAFNFLMALRSRLRETGMLASKEPNLKQYLDLVCIGTVADMVPLVDENRILVSHGLKELGKTKRPGLVALKESAGVKAGSIDADNIAFQIAPRINAAGRVERAMTALKLLISENPGEAAHLASILNRENTSRQKLEEEIFREALEMLGDSPDRGIVLYSDGWHPGVIGIVASRLVERFSKPTVMIAMDGTVGKGSARGVRSFDILDGLKSCSELLLRFGGHKAAAGLTINRENIERFKTGFFRYLNSSVTEDDLTPEILLDSVVSLEEVDGRLLDEIGSLAPFGASNREPLLCISGADIVTSEVVGNKHLRVMVRQNGCSRSGIGFGLARLHPMKGEGYSVVFSPYVDEWQGTKNLKLRIKDVKEGCVNFLT
ncbi:MAG: single-stranded-DNA-specific exonuclease RecJ [Deltaproteobacteria bacterium]|nr:single-stranded-DNA-specific exonuclease RecJ [Deltaproteobacteria bacterium]